MATIIPAADCPDYVEFLTDLRDSHGFLKINAALAKRLGPSAQTLTALAAYPHFNRSCFENERIDPETKELISEGFAFAEREKFAEWCGVPVDTFDKHIVKLSGQPFEFIDKRGRGANSFHGKRDTRRQLLMLRFHVLNRWLEGMHPFYLTLPRWVFDDSERWAWSERIVFGYALSKWFLDGNCEASEREIAKRTSLHRSTVNTALLSLRKRNQIQQHDGSLFIVGNRPEIVFQPLRGVA